MVNIKSIRLGALAEWLSALIIYFLIGLSAHAQPVVTYFHNDISGSPMVATDAAGNVVWKESYRPYGDKLRNEPASSNGTNKIGYAGSPFDASTGLSYMGARYYDPQIGRFMGIDPVGFQEDNIHSFNRYAYANNNPYKFVDRDGRLPVLAYAAYVVAVRASVYLAQRQAGAIAAAQFGAEIATGASLGGAAVGGMAAREIGAGAKIAKEGIYEFKEGAKTYCGQSCDIPRRLKEHIDSGKLAPDMLSTLKTTEVLGGKTAREIAEHRRIQDLTGGIPARFSDNVSNKVDPMGPNRSHLLNE